MRACRPVVRFLTIGAVGGLFLSSSVLAGEQFKRFPETISPDGAYVLGWGPSLEGSPELAELSEVPYQDEAFDEANREGGADNYLIDVAAGKAVAKIPGFEFFRGPQWHKNRADLEMAWSADAQSALAIYDGRWGSEGVVWIEPRTRKIVDVQKQLEKAFYGVLHKHEPGFDEVDILFRDAALVRPGLLVVHASGTVPKERDTAEYLLKFKVEGEGEKIQFRLQSGRKLPENAAPATDQENEAELNKIYSKVRANLSPARRDTLRDEQARWLKLRENISNEECRQRFTDHRIVELRARLEAGN